MRTLADGLRSIGLTHEEERRTPARHAALREDAAGVAIRLFRDQGTATAGEVTELLREAPEVAPLLDLAGDLFRARLRLDLVEHLYLFSDWRTSAPNEVLAPGETAAILYHAARSRASGRVLDLGCGSGALALLLAGGARQVIGTDLNPRAVDLSARNAGINGAANVEFRAGSLFNPVEGERFDLIVCQPPFVPQPPGAARNLFLHGGERGDEIARQVIAAAPRYLAPGGRAYVYSDWPLSAGEALGDRVPHDAALIRLYASRPITCAGYAAGYGEALERHFQAMQTTGVRQCLAVIEEGSGVEEREVLPHQWLDLRLDLPL